MNKIYKIVWNAARGCYVVASEMAKSHQGKKSLKASILAAFALAAAGGAAAYAESAVTVVNPDYSDKVVANAISGGGTKYEIANQQVSGDKALNRFIDFKLEQNDIANLNLSDVNHQINVVNNKINIDGVVNALKNGQIGGDVYFFSNKGIAVGKTGVINVGRLTLGTNARAGDIIFSEETYRFFEQPLAKQAAMLRSDIGGGSTAEDGARISIAGQINAKESILISSEKDIGITGDALLRTGATFSDPNYSLPATDPQYRNQFVNFTGVAHATGVAATEEGILLYGDNVAVDVQGNFYATDVDASRKADFSAQGMLTVESLKAGTDAIAEAEGTITIVNGSAKENLTITSTQGGVVGKTLLAKEGTATITAADSMNIIESLKSGQDSIVKVNGGETYIESVSAGGKVDLYAKGLMVVPTLKAGTDAKAEAEGVINIVDGSAKNDLTITSTQGGVAGKTLRAEEGTTTITAENGVTITESLKSSQNSIVKVNGGETYIESVAAGGKVDLYAKGLMAVTTLKAGTDAIAEAEGIINIVDGRAKKNLTITSTKGGVAGGTLTAAEGTATITAESGVSIVGSLTSKKDSILKTNGGEMEIESVAAGGKVDLYAKGLMAVTTLKAGTDTIAEAEGIINIVDGRAKKNLTITSTKGGVAGGTLLAEEGTATITTADSMNIIESLKSGQDSIVKVNGGEMYIESVAAGGKVDLYAKGLMAVTTLKAGTDAIAEAEGIINIVDGRAKKNLTITSTKGGVAGKTLLAEEGTATITSGGGVNIIESLTSGQDSIVSANGGDLEANLIDAGRMAILHAKGKVDVKTLKAGFDGEVTVDGDITIGSTTVTKDLTLTSTGGSIEGTALEASGGKVTITAAKDVTIQESLKSSADMEVKANDGSLKVKEIESGGNAELYAKDDVQITTATAADDLTITAGEGGITADTVTSTGGKTKLRSTKGAMSVKALTADADAEIQADGDISITTGKVGDHLTITSDNGSIEGISFETTEGKATITAAKNVKIMESLKSKGDAEIKALGGALTAESIKANDNATLYSQGLMDIEKLETVKGNATLTTDDSMDVTNSQIAGALTMKAAKNITVSQSNSVNKTIMEAGGTIQTKEANANISSDEIEMTAGENILITDRSPVEKLTGVDLDEAAAVTGGSGDTGSLLNGEATGHEYDVTKKGTATLTARKGKASLKAKRIEADTAIIGTEGAAIPASLTMEVDNAAIDDLQSEADVLHVMIHGNTSDNTHYAGLHNSTEGSAIVKDSHIDHLNFTGNNDIGTENSTFAGDSIIQTEKVLFNLWKNPGNTTAESIGKLFIHDYDIASSEYFTRIRNGLTINGERFPYTAGSVMNKSLFGDNYLGKDGKEKEEENTIYTKELRFGEVTGKEAYRVVES